MSNFRFHKEERLCSRKLIEKVLKDGRSIVNHPFRLKWVKAELNTKYPAQVALSVPKKNFNRSVDRNRVKRLMREVYRKNKSKFYETLSGQQIQCAILLGYIGKTIPDYAEVEKSLLLTLQRFEENIVAGSR